MGILKKFKAFDKINKDYRKYIYAAISSLFSIGASAVYLVVTKAFQWSSFGIAAVAIFALNQAIYSVYETYGIRALLRKVGSAFSKVLSHKKKSDSAVPENHELEIEPVDSPELIDDISTETQLKNK